MKRAFIATLAALTLFSGVGVNTAHADNDRRDRHNDHDWNKGKHWDNNQGPKKVYYNYNQRYYTPPTSRVVYYYPQQGYYPQQTSYYYSSGPAFTQTFASPTTYTETYYPNGGYSRTYTVGGYLPQDRNWQPIPDYVRYGLPSPGRNQRWVGHDRDALLVSEATSRIISGIVLASSIR